jgi:polyisoprenoid-binding protein YceI
MKKAILLVAMAALSLISALGQVSSWDIDPAHSAAHFAVRHMMVSNVRGAFSKVTGTITLDEKDITKSSVEATIDATTVDTREPQRDTHLRSADFLDVAKFPTISFKSTQVLKGSGDKLKVNGDLTLHGVTKQVELEVEPLSPPIKDQRGNMKSGVSAATKISRKEFGLVWNRVLEAGGVAVSDEVSIELELEITKKAAPAAN